MTSHEQLLLQQFINDINGLSNRVSGLRERGDERYLAILAKLEDIKDTIEIHKITGNGDRAESPRHKYLNRENLILLVAIKTALWVVLGHLGLEGSELLQLLMVE